MSGDIATEVRDFLDRHWDHEQRRPRDGDGDRWTQRVFEAGWAVASWPRELFGRGLGEDDARIVVDAFRKAGAPGAGQEQSNIPAAVLKGFAADDGFRRRILPELLTGRASICLLYSEPGAGSDLASLRTRADRVGENYVVNGQKVWTSGARTADYGLLIARTDWDLPKHQGISFFIVDMRRPGIEIRPINQITGDSHFNEVFLTDVIVPGDQRVGAEGEGWRVLQTALAVERRIMGEGAGERRQGADTTDVVSLIDVAREAGRIGDPLIRQQLAQALAYRQLNALNMARARKEAGQGAPSEILSLAKLAMSRILHGDAAVMTRILGAASMIDGPGHALASDANYRTANAYMTSIGGGTDQIQRNIVAERVLGLPREIELDRDVPFRQSRALSG